MQINKIVSYQNVKTLSRDMRKPQWRGNHRGLKGKINPSLKGLVYQSQCDLRGRATAARWAARAVVTDFFITLACAAGAAAVVVGAAKAGADSAKSVAVTIAVFVSRFMIFTPFLAPIILRLSLIEQLPHTRLAGALQICEFDEGPMPTQ
jgi:hypothetical protein